MIVDIFNKNGEKTGRTVALPTEVFGIEPNEHCVYLAVKQYLANQRQGTHKAKERSEVSGSTRKLHKQKGSGGARRGDINSPLLVGGGRVFGPRPRDYSQKLNKKVRILARKSALSFKAKGSNIFVLEDFSLDTPKTKDIVNMLSNMAILNRKNLLVTNGNDKNVYLSSRNIPLQTSVNVDNVSTYHVVRAGNLVIFESAVQKLAVSLS